MVLILSLGREMEPWPWKLDLFKGFASASRLHRSISEDSSFGVLVSLTPSADGHRLDLGPFGENYCIRLASH